jgi:hypothetical protein
MLSRSVALTPGEEEAVLCDLHAHIYDEPDYAKTLAATARDLGIDKMCVSGGEARYGMAGNEDALEAALSYPDLFIPFACVHLGQEGPAHVEELHRLGFKGLRVCAPPAACDAAEFFATYEAAAALGMPVLFHTGFLPPTELDRAVDVRSDRMRPVHLDTLARQIPRLRIIGCGLGGPWYEEASEVLRRHENVCFDLSGKSLRNKGVAFFRNLLGSESGQVVGQPDGNAVWSKIVFGTGVRHDEIGSVERDYSRLFRTLGLPSDVVDGIMGGNAGRLLGL